MENKNNTNSNKKIGVLIIAIVVAVILLVGGTYSYWQWQSDDGNKTLINFVISRPNFTIVGDNVTSNKLAPTTNCANATYGARGTATVSAVNDTGTLMTASITLKGRLTPASNRTLSESDKEHIHWAIKEVTSANINTYTTNNCNSSSNTTSYSTGTFAGVGNTYVDIPTSISFDTSASENSITKYYQVYVWIDSDYVYTAVGDQFNDPMQDLTVDLTFSETSNLSQSQSSSSYKISNVSATDKNNQPVNLVITLIDNTNDAIYLEIEAPSGTSFPVTASFTIDNCSQSMLTNMYHYKNADASWENINFTATNNGNNGVNVNATFNSFSPVVIGKQQHNANLYALTGYRQSTGSDNYYQNLLRNVASSGYFREASIVNIENYFAANHNLFSTAEIDEMISAILDVKESIFLPLARSVFGNSNIDMSTLNEGQKIEMLNNLSSQDINELSSIFSSMWARHGGYVKLGGIELNDGSYYSAILLGFREDEINIPFLILKELD